MEFPYLSIFIWLNFAFVATHADLTPGMYWKFNLPTTQMPKAITDLLYPGFRYANEERKTSGEHAAGDYTNVGLFFFEKDLHNGTKFNMQLTKDSNYGERFMSREVANYLSLPFSSNKVEYILNHFSIKQGSNEYEFVKTTIRVCEEPGIKGEEKLCVTSLESMVDFITSKLGKYVEAFSTEVNGESDIQQYIIAKGVKKLGKKNKAIVCHKMNYPYVVFNCHKSDTTRVYSVPLEGADGSRVRAVVVCHTDTSQWNPKHIAFQVLKVQRGTVPVCHFVPQDHVVWVSKNPKFLGLIYNGIPEDDDVWLSK